MQLTFDFGASGLIGEAWRRLTAHFGPADFGPARTPIGQLVKSLISNRTYDAVSLGAYERLTEALSWSAIAGAPVGRIEALIADVEFADAKARHLKAAMQQVEAAHADFDLAFLGALPEDEALEWLQRLPGVGPKVAASVLNFSTLGRPAFVIDTHVARILRRLGVIGPRTTAAAAHGQVIGALARWSPPELTELHVQMKRLGQAICRPQRPHCGVCPISATCRRSGVGEEA